MNYESPKSTWLMRRFWAAAGADSYILEKATYSDQIKYFCLGGIVMATGIMAGLAGGYAFYTVFSEKTANVLDETHSAVANTYQVPIDNAALVLSIIFGFLWGLMIFNLDRFIVTSTGKGDGTEKITGQEFLNALPRMFLGTIIAITISAPLEIRIFKSEIDLEVAKQQEKEKSFGIEQAKINFDKKVADTKIKLGKISEQIDAKEKAIAELREQISKEITGANGNGAAYGPRAAQLERQAGILEGQLKDLKSTHEYQTAMEDEERYKKEYNTDIKISEQKAANLDGLLIRIKKAHELSFMISLFITLLFWAIELTPIFFKMMLTKTPYDYITENRDDLIKAKYGIEVQYDKYEDKEGVERHLVINHEAERLIFEKKKVTEIQNELTEYAVNLYKERERGRIENNLDDYIKKLEDDGKSES